MDGTICNHRVASLHRRQHTHAASFALLAVCAAWLLLLMLFAGTADATPGAITKVDLIGNPRTGAVSITIAGLNLFVVASSKNRASGTAVEANMWISQTSMVSKLPSQSGAVPQYVQMVVSAQHGLSLSTSVNLFSTNAPVIRQSASGNVPPTGAVSVTVTGIGMGVGAMSLTSSGGATAMTATTWISDTVVAGHIGNCRASLRQSIPIAVTIAPPMVAVLAQSVSVDAAPDIEFEVMSSAQNFVVATFQNVLSQWLQLQSGTDVVVLSVNSSSPVIVTVRFNVAPWTDLIQALKNDLQGNYGYEGFLYTRLAVDKAMFPDGIVVATQVEWIRRLTNGTAYLSAAMLGASIVATVEATAAIYFDLPGSSAVESALLASAGGFGGWQILLQLQYNSIMGKMGTVNDMPNEMWVFAYGFDWSNFFIYEPMPWGSEPDLPWAYATIGANATTMLNIPDTGRVCGVFDQPNYRWISVAFVFGVCFVTVVIARLVVSFAVISSAKSSRTPPLLDWMRWETYALIAVLLASSYTTALVARHSCPAWWITCIVIAFALLGVYFVLLLIAVFYSVEVASSGEKFIDHVMPTTEFLRNRAPASKAFLDKLRYIGVCFDRITDSGRWEVRSLPLYRFVEPVIGDYTYRRGGYLVGVYSIMRIVAVGIVIGYVRTQPQQIVVTILYGVELVLVCSMQPYRNRLRNIIEPIACAARTLVPLAATLSAYNVIGHAVTRDLMIYAAMVATITELLFGVAAIYWLFFTFVIALRPVALSVGENLTFTSEYTKYRMRHQSALAHQAPLDAEENLRIQERTLSLPPGRLDAGPFVGATRPPVLQNGDSPGASGGAGVGGGGGGGPLPNQLSAEVDAETANLEAQTAQLAAELEQIRSETQQLRSSSSSHHTPYLHPLSTTRVVDTSEPPAGSRSLAPLFSLSSIPGVRTIQPPQQQGGTQQQGLSSSRLYSHYPHPAASSAASNMMISHGGNGRLAPVRMIPLDSSYLPPLVHPAEQRNRSGGATTTGGGGVVGGTVVGGGGGGGATSYTATMSPRVFSTRPPMDVVVAPAVVATTRPAVVAPETVRRTLDFER